MRCNNNARSAQTAYTDGDIDVHALGVTNELLRYGTVPVYLPFFMLYITCLNLVHNVFERVTFLAAVSEGTSMSR